MPDRYCGPYGESQRKKSHKGSLDLKWPPNLKISPPTVWLMVFTPSGGESQGWRCRLQFVVQP